MKNKEDAFKFAEFKRQLEEGKCFAAYLFEGEDFYFRKTGLALLKEKFIEEESLNVVNLEGDSVTASNLLAAVRSYPFLSPKRITVVREFYPDKNFFTDDLKRFLSVDNPDSLLFISNEKKSEQLKKVPGIFVVDCGKEDVSAVVRYVRGECEKSGVSIDGETAMKIATFCLCDMTRVEIETAKLISHAGEGGRITVDDVIKLVPRDTEYKIYQMTEKIARKNFDDAMEIIFDMLEKGEPPQRLTVSIYNYFRRLLHCAISPENDIVLGEYLGAQDFVIRKAREQAKLFKVSAIKKAVDVLSDADYKVKSGKSDALAEFWLSVFRIMIG